MSNLILKVTIRKADKSDSSEIIRLIKELAEFEKLEPPDKLACRRLIKDAFSINPPFEILVAENYQNILAYAFYFYTYSTFRARKTLYLEDIYVSNLYRSHGIGQRIFKQLIRIAKKNRCSRMEWCVLNWNKNAIKFYEKIGANPLDEWTYYRLVLD
ncbi:GNAT family N-acetyltransferase [Ignavibacteria bacterium CHB1]|nr:MAG: GNAT family N-acetyltransferase [Chlorobiota bacterium]MCE7953795.1 GNAT family N-acetyltransferase [Chlorobi bacterium CHB7]MDL1887729.1 GNAT family N-acetyltransferase [Ignavibacteria bacterium CHB1]OQY76842.1 MAG: hypothetical protein B6D43_09485 [Ignavibacteriales bacterium UTCHB1]RIK48278.1 MAG: N-acetyltransferase [Ignavibacteriota bacterium]